MKFLTFFFSVLVFSLLLIPSASHAAYNFVMQSGQVGSYAWSGTPVMQALAGPAYITIDTWDNFCADTAALVPSLSDTQNVWCVMKYSNSVSYGCIYDGPTCGWQGGTGSSNRSAYLYTSAPSQSTSGIDKQSDPPYQCNNWALTLCYPFYHAAVASPPTASLTANPTSVSSGNASLLTWSSTNATSCTGTGFNTGGATSGSVSTGALTSTTAYSVSCTGAGGTANANTTVTVTAPPLSASCSVSPTTVTTNTNVTWTAAASGGTPPYTYTWSGSSPLSGTDNPKVVQYTTTGTKTGSVTVSDSAARSTGAVVCTAGGGGVPGGGASTTVSPPSPTSDITATPNPVPTGNPTTITWSSTNASSCTGTGFSTGGATSGSVQVTPSGTSNYQVTCDGAVDTVTVTVTTPTVDISATPDRVATGGSVNISWTSNQADSCTVTRDGAAFGSGLSGTNVPASNITSQTAFAASCASGGVPGAATDSVIVNIIPTFEEF